MSVEGQWNVTMDTPLGKQQFSLAFSQMDGSWSGTLVSARTGTSELTAIEVTGSTVSFKTKVSSPMGPLQVSMSGTVNDDAFNGLCETSFGNVNFIGTRA